MDPLKEYVLGTDETGGSFGYRRKFDVHTGVDLYCEAGAEVFAIEDGEVIEIMPFTGEQIGMDWWHDTDAVMVEGASGVILYGELEPNPELKVGSMVKTGDLVGKILTVLKKDKGRPMSMLHLELYKTGYRGGWVAWDLDGDKPTDLLDPTGLISSVI